MAAVQNDEAPSGTGISGERYFNVTACSGDPTMGSVTVHTESVPTHTASVERSAANAAKGFPEGTVLLITATSREGCRFVKWNDGNTNARRKVTVNADAEYVASFERVPENAGAENDPSLGGAAGSGSGVLGTSTKPAAAKQEGIIQLLRKWWWAVLVLALMIYDMKGGE